MAIAETDRFNMANCYSRTSPRQPGQCTDSPCILGEYDNSYWHRGQFPGLAISGIVASVLQSGQLIMIPAPAASATKCLPHASHLKKTSGISSSAMNDTPCLPGMTIPNQPSFPAAAISRRDRRWTAICPLPPITLNSETLLEPIRCPPLDDRRSLRPRSRNRGRLRSGQAPTAAPKRIRGKLQAARPAIQPHLGAKMIVGGL
jgi:hypothetical protein